MVLKSRYDGLHSVLGAGVRRKGNREGSASVLET
jgi:hypothetical protein